MNRGFLWDIMNIGQGTDMESPLQTKGRHKSDINLFIQEVTVEKITADKTLDARGLSCPMPSVKTALALEAMGSGQVLLVLTDDPVSKKDLPIWAEATGNTLLGLTEEDSTISIYLRKG